MSETPAQLKGRKRYLLRVVRLMIQDRRCSGGRSDSERYFLRDVEDLLAEMEAELDA